MKNLFYIFTIISLLTFVSCKRNVAIKSTQEISIEERLKSYFELYRITPLVTIEDTDESDTIVHLGSHTIEWFDLEDTSMLVKIDDDLFSLKNYQTLNEVWGNKDSLTSTYYWNEIKLYKHNGREYIGIRMAFYY